MALLGEILVKAGLLSKQEFGKIKHDLNKHKQKPKGEKDKPKK